MGNVVWGVAFFMGSLLPLLPCFRWGGRQTPVLKISILADFKQVAFLWKLG